MEIHRYIQKWIHLAIKFELHLPSNILSQRRTTTSFVASLSVVLCLLGYNFMSQNTAAGVMLFRHFMRVRPPGHLRQFQIDKLAYLTRRNSNTLNSELCGGTTQLDSPEISAET